MGSKAGEPEEMVNKEGGVTFSVRLNRRIEVFQFRCSFAFTRKVNKRRKNEEKA